MALNIDPNADLKVLQMGRSAFIIRGKNGRTIGSGFFKKRREAKDYLADYKAGKIQRKG